MSVKLQIEADGKQLIREYELADAAQEKLERGAAELARTQTRGQEQVQREVRKTTEAYELADRQARARSLRASADVRAARGGRTYALAPVSTGSPPPPPPIIPPSNAGPIPFMPTAAQFATQWQAHYAGRLAAGRIGDIQSMHHAWRAQGTTMANAASMAYIAGGGIYDTGDDRLMRRARRRVARRAGEMGLDMSPDDFETTSRVQYDDMRRRRDRIRYARQVGAQGALAVGAAVTGVMSWADQELTRYADEITRVEDMIGPLASVGNNMGSRRLIRRRILSESVGRGMDAAQIASMDFTLESAAADLPDDVRQEMRRTAFAINKLQGGDPGQIVTGINSAYQLLKDQLPGGAGGVRTIANKLGLAADVGSFEIDQFTPYMGMILGTFKAMGYTPDEALASTAVVSRAGMRPETFSTALRNLPMMMSQAKKKGFTMTGDFGRDMGSLGALESPEMLAITGRDPFVAAKFLADNLGLYDQTRRQIAGQGSRQDLFGAKQATAATDPMYMTSEVIKSARALQNNAAALRAQNPWLRDKVESWEITKAGAAATSNPLLSWFDKPAAWIRNAMGGEENDLFRAGLMNMIADATDAGDVSKAGYLSLRYSSENFGSNTYYQDAQGQRVYTGEADARAFLGMRSAGMTDLSTNEYLQYLQLQATQGEQAAQAFLARPGVGFAKDGAAAAGGDASAKLTQAGQLLIDAAAQMGAPAPDPNTQN